MTNTDDLLEVLRKALSCLPDDDSVSVISLSATAMEQLDPDGTAPTLVAWAATLQLRQLARQLLRKTYEDKDPNDPQATLFTALQDRYPGAGDHSGLYVPRMQLTLADRCWNIHRLRKEAEAKLAHADALEAETESLVEQGYFAAAA